MTAVPRAAAALGVAPYSACSRSARLGRSTGTDAHVDFGGAIEFIDENAGSDDVVLDMVTTQLSPVPTTSIDAGTDDVELFNVYQPAGPPPFLSAYVPPAPVIERAAESAMGGRLIVVGPEGAVKETPEGIEIVATGANVFITAAVASEPDVVISLPGWKLDQTTTFLRGRGHVSVLSPPDRTDP